MTPHRIGVVIGGFADGSKGSDRASSALALRAFAVANSLDRLRPLRRTRPGPALALRAFATAIDSLDRLLPLRGIVAHSSLSVLPWAQFM